MKIEQVLIIGGGLAGCALAESFSRRGCQVLVLARGNRLGGAVATLPLIAQHPTLTPDFDLRSRFLIRAMQWHTELRAGPAQDLQSAFEVCGRVQPMAAERAERCLQHVPPELARLVGGASASTTEPAGILFTGCAAVSPARWWAAVLARPGVQCRLGVTVGRIEARFSAGPWPEDGTGVQDVMEGAVTSDQHPVGMMRGNTQDDGRGAGGLAAQNGQTVANGVGGWEVFDPDGRCLASADCLILACREEALSLADMQEADHGRLRMSAARVWMARADAGKPTEDPGRPALLPIMGGQGLALTRPGRFWLRSEERYQSWLQTGVWAEHDPLRETADSAPSAWADYLKQPESWYPSEVGERLQCRDNLPMIGQAPDLKQIDLSANDLAKNDRLPIPRRPGLYLLTALAGRGALYAALGAEMIAADAFGEAPVVDEALARAVDPARFIKRRLQRAWSQRAG